MDGYGVSIWNDIWIPWLQEKRIGHPGLVESQLPKMVAEIIYKEKGEWNLQIIDHWLTDEQTKEIKAIPVSVHEGKNVIVWPYSKDGIYSVKSIYNRLVGKEMCPRMCLSPPI